MPQSKFGIERTNQGCSMVDTAKFWDDGYLIIRGALSPDQVARWRVAGLEAREDRDLLSDPALREVIYSPVLVEAAREILGGQPVYFGDSTVLRGTAGFGFHKDNSDRTDERAPDWQVDRYPIIRFGIYTEAHGELPNGLDLRVGSHRHADYKTGKMVTAAVEPGDVVVWNGRTTHSGNSKIFRLIGHRMEPDPTGFFFRALNRVGGLPFLFRRHPEERVAIFASYALAGDLLDRHIEYLRQREYAIEWWRNSEWSESTKAKVSSAGLDLLDVTSFVHDGRTLNRDYAPIPY